MLCCSGERYRAIMALLFLSGTLQNKMQTLSKLNAKPFIVTIYVQVLFYSLVLKKALFHFSPIVNMAANHAKICRVGKLEADFYQVPFVQIFSIIQNQQ